MTFERENSTYRRNLPALARAHPGKFVLIHGDDVVSVHATRDEAMKGGYEKFGVLEPFLVRKIRTRPLR
jgi:hypothetical protein